MAGLENIDQEIIMTKLSRDNVYICIAGHTIHHLGTKQVY